MRIVKIHFGCGHYKLKGWINVDWDKSCKPDLVTDLTQPLPFKSHTVDYIHSEDFIEQIELEAAYSFFHESFRILKEDGVMRVLKPDLYEFAKRYFNRDSELIGLWEREVGIPLRTGTLGELFNLGIRLLGHRFLYDENTLIRVLRECGFKPKRVTYHESDEKELRESWIFVLPRRVSASILIVIKENQERRIPYPFPLEWVSGSKNFGDGGDKAFGFQ